MEYVRDHMDGDYVKTQRNSKNTCSGKEVKCAICDIVHMAREL